MQRTLRAHHLLCIPLFQGYGYSDGFCQNMTEQIKWLREHPKEEILLICGPDRICENCPNLIKGKICKEENNSVLEKDRLLLQALGMKEESSSFGALLQEMKRRMKEEIFLESCRNCSWREQGLCTYEKYRKGLNELCISAQERADDGEKIGERS